VNHTLLNEHDANQGAQSRGEFLGMTGNSGWYLLGSVGASLLLVIVCWGILGVSLLLCLFAGIVLCGLAVAYVFALKNNRPEHFDTDYFESVLIEAGVLEMAFGPRTRRIGNPFTSSRHAIEAQAPVENESSSAPARRGGNAVSSPRGSETRSAAATPSESRRRVREVTEPVVPLAAFESVRDELDLAEDLLEDALTERTEV
jgi:hypothetical protein